MNALTLPGDFGPKIKIVDLRKKTPDKSEVAQSDDLPNTRACSSGFFRRSARPSVFADVILERGSSGRFFLISQYFFIAL